MASEGLPPGIMELPPRMLEKQSSMPEATHRPLSTPRHGADSPQAENGHQRTRTSDSPAVRMRTSDSPAPLTARGETVRVRVVARVRPLIPLETVGPLKGSNCVEVVTPSIAIGKSCFTFDHVFSPEAAQEEVYEDCVAPLVDATLEGINGTLFAYGQTGSGKTYTMGTSGLSNAPDGALQRAVRAIFERALSQTTAEGSLSFRVSFFEIFTDASMRRNTEEIRDLLSPGNSHCFAAIKFDPDGHGQIRLDGVAEHEVFTEKEALSLLALGSASRATGSTRMNESSSRSHAIFSLEVVQRRHVAGVPSTLTAKFQFVDLAGSEKVKISGAEGEQLSQAININHGLFVLGKVITALTEGHPHVPFRESKLTRILQNSLGGNSRTCMLACVSPSDTNLAETISTLTYAAKAKEITNKPVVNRQAVSCANCAILQNRVEALEASSKGEMPGRVPCNRQERFHGYVATLEKENVNLREENVELRQKLEHFEKAESTGPARGIASAALAPSTNVQLEESSSLRDAKMLQDTKAAASRAETLYKRCSERLASLQQAVQSAELAVDESLLVPFDEVGTASTLDLDTDTIFESCEDASVEALEEREACKADVTWLDQEARRKQSLLVQVEDNHQAMAVLEAQSQERIKHYGAALDIAERELSRLQSELNVANNRAEKLQSIRERYDEKVAAVKARRADLEKENKENKRLRSILKQQTTRLKVLQDSIVRVKDERDSLKDQLRGELRRRKDQEVQGRKGRMEAQAKIQRLNSRVAVLERSSVARGQAVAPRLHRTRSAPRAGMVGRRVEGRTPSSSCEVPLTQGKPWDRLLEADAELSLRENKLMHAKAQLDHVEDQALEARAHCERLALEREVDSTSSELTGEAQQQHQQQLLELEAVVAAVEYHREQVWLLTCERDACRPQGGSLAKAAALCAEGLRAEELTAGLVWLCAEAAEQRAAAAAADDMREAREADMGAYREALVESQHQAAELEQAFDFTRSDYESRIAYLISRVNDGNQMGAAELQETLGEEAPALLTRRIGELEAQLKCERKDSQDKSHRRLEKDMELISSYREQESENKLLRSRLTEANSAVERAVARCAKKEAQFLQQVSTLEAECASRKKNVKSEVNIEGPCTVEVSWGLSYLEDFWRTTGLDAHREELLVSLRSDIESLCKQRLSDHLEWKRALEGKVDRLQLELSDLGTLLGESLEAPNSNTSLMQKAQDLEASISAMARIKEDRAKEFSELTSRIMDLHTRLHETPSTDELLSAQDAGALRISTLEKLRDSLASLETLERDRHKLVAGRFEQVKQLWATVGLEGPDDIEPMEISLLQGPLPVSDSCIAYLDSRLAQLIDWRDNLEPEESALQEKFAEMHTQLAVLGVTLPEVPQGLSLLPCIKALRTMVAGAESAAAEFIGSQKLHLETFGEATQLLNVLLAYSELMAARSLRQQLHIIGMHWERLCGQRTEHQRICELIESREALEKDMSKFDVEASHPDRFRKRGYNGVQENKIRADYQRRLRMLDASLDQSIGEWSQREGVTFCKEDGEYRGAEILPSAHTHMYAWTGKQIAQKHAGTALPSDAMRTPRTGGTSPRTTPTQNTRRSTGGGTSPRGTSRLSPRQSMSSPQGPPGRTRPQSEFTAKQLPPTPPMATPQPVLTLGGGAPHSVPRTSTGGTRSPTSGKAQAAPLSARRRS